MSPAVNTAVANFALAMWGGFDFFPSAMPTATCQQYLLCLLFLQAVSTMPKQETPNRQAWQQCGLLVAHEAQLSILQAMREQEGNGGRIKRALDALTYLNPAQLGSKLAVSSFDSPLLGGAQERDKLLNSLLRHVEQECIALPEHVADPHFFGEVFSEVLRLFADYHDASAKFYTSPQPDIERDMTPRPVAQLMARLLDPMPGDMIYDPAFGTGSMLLESAQWCRQTHGAEPRILYGQELNFDRCALARMRLSVYGLDTTHLIYGDALARRTDDDSTSPRCPRLPDTIARNAPFDVVLSAPPIVVPSDTAEPEAACKLVKRAGLGFALTMLARLTPQTGRMGVLLPISALARSDQREMRKELVQANAIDSVILLPACLLQHYPEPAAIVLMRRDAAYSPVFIVDARQLVPKKDPRLDDVIERIVQAFLPKREIPGFSRLVTWAALEMAKFDFSEHFAPALDGGIALPAVAQEESTALCMHMQ